MNSNNPIEIFATEDGSTEIQVRLQQDTVWLSLNQITELFDRDKSVISRHLANVFKEGELKRNSVVAKFATTAADGKTYQVEYFNLDVIISVGYRVKSKRGTQFRIWATNVLRQYLVDGYALNQKRLLEQQQAQMNKLQQTIRMISEMPERTELSTNEATSIKAALGKMQDKYDDETDHSLIRHRQRRWEYQIDSLLKVYSEEPNKMTDYYSGVSAFFPVKPSFTSGIQNQAVPYRRYDLKKYGVGFTVESHMLDTFNVEIFENQFVESFDEDSVKILSYQKDFSQYEYAARILVKDEVYNQIIHYHLGYHENILFRISATYREAEEVSGYEETANSFLNSFEFVDTNPYWIDRLMKSNVSTIVSTITKGKQRAKKETINVLSMVSKNHMVFIKVPSSLKRVN